jgi:hypothetical protein
VHTDDRGLYSTSHIQSALESSKADQGKKMPNVISSPSINAARALETPSAAAASTPESTLHFAYRGGDKARYKFSKNEIIIGTSAEILIDLSAGIPEDTDLGTPEIQHIGGEINIDSYCCTETNLGRVHLLTKSPKKADPNSHKPVPFSMKDQAAQLTADGGRVQEVRLKFDLESRQLVFVGIVVKLITLAGEKKWFLCDPQVGNGPPGAGKIFEAVSLV